MGELLLGCKLPCGFIQLVFEECVWPWAEVLAIEGHGTQIQSFGRLGGGVGSLAGC